MVRSLTVLWLHSEALLAWNLTHSPFETSAVYFGYNDHDAWPRYPENPWGDFKSAGFPIESNLTPVNATFILKTLAKTIGILPDTLPADATFFIPGDGEFTGGGGGGTMIMRVTPRCVG